jgi:DNA-binding PadR family transcriptional regulator
MKNTHRGELEMHSGHCQKLHSGRDRFLEVCLLSLLLEGPSYGYRLLERLQEFGMVVEQIDIGSLYRTLRNMEEKGHVGSCWEDSEQGPNRRNYSITNSGTEALSKHVVHLQNRADMIQRLISFYESIKGKD